MQTFLRFFKSTITISIFIILGFACASVDSNKKNIGIVTPPMPKNLYDDGGFLIIGEKSLNGVYSDADLLAAKYAVTFVSDNKTHYCWLERIHHYDTTATGKKAFWELLDVLQLPSITKDEILVHRTCKMGNYFDPEIIALCRYDPDAEEFTHIIKAWRANREKERFEEISTSNITCINECPGDSCD